MLATVKERQIEEKAAPGNEVIKFGYNPNFINKENNKQKKNRII